MPQLDYRLTKQVKLPVSGGTLEIYDGYTVADIEQIQKSSSQQITPLLLLIKSWDFVDEDNNELEINEKNVGKLDYRDLKAIEKKIDLSAFLGVESRASTNE